jgi:hypothetical protein
MISRSPWRRGKAPRHIGAQPAPAETIVVRKALNPPADSWWARPACQSREAFDQIAAERSREAGWVGKGRES